MKIGWISDAHLDHLSPKHLANFLEKVSAIEGEALVISGDISNALRLNYHLGVIGKASPVPVYFVLGNHDYYGGTLEDVRVLASSHSYRDGVWYLTDAGPRQLTDQTWIVGVGGWGDGRAGDFKESYVWLNDYELIEDLQGYRSEKDQLLEKLHRLGDQQSVRLFKQLSKIPDEARHILVITHVPPWIEAGWHEGEVQDDNWAPHFTCIATGNVLEEFMGVNRHLAMTVLCGHTHSAGEAMILPHLKCITGSSCEDGSNGYGRPWINTTIEVP